MMEKGDHPENEQSDQPLIGHLLRERRVSMGLGIEDVVAKIKLSHRQIVALEENDFKALPEIAFLRGFVRSYARLLQMDEQALLAHLPEAQFTQVRTEQDRVETEFPTAKSARRQNVYLLLAALIVVLVILGFVLWQKPHHEPVKPETTQMTPLALPVPQHEAAPESAVAPQSAPQAVALVPQSAPQVSAVEPAVPVAESAVLPGPSDAMATLRLAFDKECWVEVRDRFGRTLSKQVNAPGSELRLEGEAPFTLVIGHAQAVHLFYRSKPVSLDPYINATSDVARLTLE